MPIRYPLTIFLFLAVTATFILQVLMSTAAQKESFASETMAKNRKNPEEFLLPIPEPWKGDFDGMRKRRLVRILVPLSKTFFFLDKARYRGTAHDLGKEFEAWLNKKYKQNAFEIRIYFIPTSRDRLLSDLTIGLGDIAIGNLTITPDRLRIVDFSDPELEKVKEVVVTGPSAPQLNFLDDLGAQEIYVRRSSSYYEHLVELNIKLKAAGKQTIKLKAGDEELEDEDLLEMVSAGLLPMVVVDDHKAVFWAQVFKNLTVRTDLSIYEGGRIAWAVRKNSPMLLAEINSFIDKQVKKRGLGNIVLRRYLRSTKYVKNAFSKSEMEKFNQVVALFKKYGDKYDFEYLMLMAQGYQESRLDQSAVSPRGAVGIMQLMPSTAENHPIKISGVDKSTENNIHAGAKYLRWIVDTYLNEPAINEQNRLLLGFAAYNAGPGNLRKFRRLAEKSNLDPNVWFHNVEHAAAKIIGRETVQYVSNIYKYYIAYKLTIERDSIRNNHLQQ